LCRLEEIGCENDGDDDLNDDCANCANYDDVDGDGDGG